MLCLWAKDMLLVQCKLTSITAAVCAIFSGRDVAYVPRQQLFKSLDNS